jgi:hypothetical protein
MLLPAIRDILVNITLHTILILENFENSKEEPFLNIYSWHDSSWRWRI